MLVARAGLSPVMVGRDAELERLRRLLQPADRPRVALVSGEAGVGKTRLIKELVAGVPAGTPILVGQAEQGAMGRPFELLLEAVEHDVAAWADVPPELRARADALHLLLAPVAPGLDRSPTRSYGNEELLRAAVDLLRYLTSGGGVLVFEDLHWADAESLALFGRLATASGLPLLLVGSYRPEDLDRRHLTDLLSGIERQRSVEHASIGRLRVDEVGELLAAVYGRAVPWQAAEALHRRTGGNPFFIEELLVAAGDAPPEDLACLPLPANLTEAVLRHLDGLDREQRRVVDAAAVLGQRIPFDLLATVTGSGEDELIDVLRDLVGRGLIREDDADVFTFRHALTREAVVSRLLGRERRRLHEKALVAMQEGGSDDWAALAHHAAGANRWDELLDAARVGAAHYLRTGSTYQALRLAELGLDEADDDLELLEVAARAAWSVGLRESAIERAEQWRALAEANGDDHAVFAALYLLARLRWESGDEAGQQRLADDVLAVAERLGDPEPLAWACNLKAEALMLALRSEEAIDWADRGVALAESHGLPHVRAALLVNRGSALIDVPGRADEGSMLLQTAIEAAAGLGDELNAMRGMNNITKVAFTAWPVEDCERLLDRMAELAARSGRRDWNVMRQGLLTSLLYWAIGDLREARRVHGLPLDAEPTAFETLWVGVQQARLELEQPDLGRSVELAGQARVRGERVGEAEVVAGATGILVEAAARRGDLDTVRRELATLHDVLRRDLRACRFEGDTWARSLAAAVRAGLPAVEARTLHAAVPSEELAPDYHRDPGWSDQLEAALLEAEGRPADALDRYDAALADRGRRRAPVDVADARLGRGRCLLALDRRADAESAAAGALAVLTRWPGWRRDDAEALHRRLTAASPEPADGSSPLTPREREVAALVAQGMTNGEVARSLYISTKTASVHVSNILTKLGLSNRTELAAWALREGVAS